jgi:hypothetical protein
MNPVRRTKLTLSDDLVMAMYADYQRLGSVEKVGRLHGRTRQHVWEIFRRRGLQLNAKKFLPVVEYNGRKFTSQKTCGRHRYLRETTKGRGRRGQKDRTVYLHHVIWEENHGPIPPGHKVVFKDGNHLNRDIDNLELLTNSEQVRRHATGANQFTVTAAARLALLMANHSTGNATRCATLK